MSDSKIGDLVRAINGRLGDAESAGEAPATVGNVYRLRPRIGPPAHAGDSSDAAETVGRLILEAAPSRPLPNLRRVLQSQAHDGHDEAAIDELVDLLERAEPHTRVVSGWRQKHPLLATRLFGAS
jgi:hypothetical protein